MTTKGNSHITHAPYFVIWKFLLFFLHQQTDHKQDANPCDHSDSVYLDVVCLNIEQKHDIHNMHT